MERKIKFRAKRQPDGKWVYGDLFHTIKVTRDTDIPVIRVAGYDVDPETIGQFTGITDVDGIELYEGDVVSIRRICVNTATGETIKRQRRALIVWDSNLCSWCRQSRVGRRFHLGALLYDKSEYNRTYTRNFKFVGNIYDTPELMQQTTVSEKTTDNYENEAEAVD